MTYTILKAQWGNEERTSAVIFTKEAAAVAVSAYDTPEEWGAFLNWVKTNKVADCPAPPPPLSKHEKLERLLGSHGLSLDDLKSALHP